MENSNVDAKFDLYSEILHECICKEKIGAYICGLILDLSGLTLCTRGIHL